MHVCKEYGRKRKNEVGFAFSAGRPVSKDCGLLSKDGGKRVGGCVLLHHGKLVDATREGKNKLIVNHSHMKILGQIRFVREGGGFGFGLFFFLNQQKITLCMIYSIVFSSWVCPHSDVEAHLWFAEI